MKEVIKEVDVNSHITNIQYAIDSEGADLKAKISFDNLDEGSVVAVRLKAVGYDSFGDVITVDGKDYFYITIIDIDVDKNCFSGEIEVKLPNREIRKLMLTEHQVCYKDGKLLKYEGENVKTIKLKMFDPDCLEEQKQLEALQEVFNSKTKYDFFENSDGWICTCGKFNKIENQFCGLCNHSKEEVKYYLSEEGKRHAVEMKLERDKQYKVKMEHEEKIKKKEKRNILIVLSVVLVVVLFIGYRLAQTIILSDRQIYETEERMRTAVQGYWTYYIDMGDLGTIPFSQWYINGDMGFYIYPDEKNVPEGKTIKWYPERGMFKVGDRKVVVKKGGKVLVDDFDNIYEKGGVKQKEENGESLFGYGNEDYSYDFEASDLRVSNVKVQSNSMYTKCTGTLTNEGDRTYRFIQIKGAFRDIFGKVVDTDSTYAAGGEGLAPGESTTFEMFVDENSLIKSCQVSVFDYD